MEEALELDLAEVGGTLENDMRVLAGLLATGKCADRVHMGQNKRLCAVVWDPADEPRRDAIIAGDRCWQTPGMLNIVLTMVRGVPLYTAFTRDWVEETHGTRACLWICWGEERILKCDSHNSRVEFDVEKGIAITYQGKTATFPMVEILDLIDKTVSKTNQ